MDRTGRLVGTAFAKDRGLERRTYLLRGGSES